MMLSDRHNVEVDPRLEFFKCYEIPKMTQLRIRQLVRPFCPPRSSITAIICAEAVPLQSPLPSLDLSNHYSNLSWS